MSDEPSLEGTGPKGPPYVVRTWANRIDEAVDRVKERSRITSRDHLLGLLEAVQCGKVSRDDAAKHLEFWADCWQQDTLALIRETSAN